MSAEQLADRSDEETPRGQVDIVNDDDLSHVRDRNNRLIGRSDDSEMPAQNDVDSPADPTTRDSSTRLASFRDDETSRSRRGVNPQVEMLKQQFAHLEESTLTMLIEEYQLADPQTQAVMLSQWQTFAPSMIEGILHTMRTSRNSYAGPSDVPGAHTDVDTPLDYASHSRSTPARDDVSAPLPSHSAMSARAGLGATPWPATQTVDESNQTAPGQFHRSPVGMSSHQSGGAAGSSYSTQIHTSSYQPDRMNGAPSAMGTDAGAFPPVFGPGEPAAGQYGHGASPPMNTYTAPPDTRYGPPDRNANPFPSRSEIDPFDPSGRNTWGPQSRTSGTPSPFDQRPAGMTTPLLAGMSASSFDQYGRPHPTRPAYLTLPSNGGGGNALLSWRSELLPVIRTLEIELSDLARNVTPETRERYESMAAAHRTLSLFAGNRDVALQPIPGLEPKRQQFWQSLVWGLSNYLDSDSIADSEDRATLAASHLQTAVHLLESQARLLIPTVAFCQKIRSFGDYDAVATSRFQPDQEVMLYVEIRNHQSERAPGQKGWQTRVRSRIQIERDDASNALVHSYDFDSETSVSMGQRREYYHSYNFPIPRACTPGNYRLVLTVEDEVGKKIATESVTFEVTAN